MSSKRGHQDTSLFEQQHSWTVSFRCVYVENEWWFNMNCTCRFALRVCRYRFCTVYSMDISVACCCSSQNQEMAMLHNSTDAVSPWNHPGETLTIWPPYYCCPVQIHCICHSSTALHNTNSIGNVICRHGHRLTVTDLIAWQGATAAHLFC